MPTISQEGKEELALALLLWREFKCQDQPPNHKTEMVIQMFRMANHLDVRAEVEALLPKLPLLRWIER